MLTSVDATKKIQKNIEDYFSDEANKEWFTKQGITTEEDKKKLKESLLVHVEKQMDVNPKSQEGRNFVRKIQEMYDGCADMDKDFFLQNSCAFLRAVSDKITEAGNEYHAFDNALTLWKGNNSDRDYGLISGALYDAITDDSIALSREMDVTHENIRVYNAYFAPSVEVKFTDFLEHAKNGSFTNEDKIWAEDYRQTIVETLAEQGVLKSVAMEDFMLNGKPMFTKEDIENKRMDELSCKIVENMLKGEAVAVKNPENGEMSYLVSNLKEQEKSNSLEEINDVVNSVDTQKTQSKSFFERVYDFFKDLFSEERRMVAMLQRNIDTKEGDRKAVYQRVTFDELIGKNAVDRINTAPPKGKQLSAEHKLEKGLSAGH